MEQINLDGVSTLDEKIKTSIERIKEYDPLKDTRGGAEPNCYKIGFSGGKDSICCKHLCNLAGVKYEAHYSLTTIDPPSVTSFIRKNYSDVIWDKPIYKKERTNFYALVARKGLPTRLVRWCCGFLKEVNGKKGDTLILGVRWAESAKRSSRPIFNEYKGVKMLNPIVDWTDEDVWNFIHRYNLPYPDLYDDGHKRLGCIMCPLSCRKARIRDYDEYPKHVKAVEKAVAKFLEYKPESTLKKWGSTPEEIVYYWVHESPLESAKGACMQQISEEKEN